MTRGSDRARRASDLYLDSRVLNTYEVEMIAMDMVDNDPAMVVDVRVQRVNCVRDKFGNVVQASALRVERGESTCVMLRRH